MLMQSTSAGRGAVVSKSDPGRPSEYLRLGEAGAMSWVQDPTAATPFPSLRDATRVALRLPAKLRAFGLPLEISSAGPN
jgi:hypothetical protein